MSKDVGKLLKELREQGWIIEATSGGHIKLRHPAGGQIIYCSSTPSDRRAVHQVRADVRRVERALAA